MGYFPDNDNLQIVNKRKDMNVKCLGADLTPLNVDTVIGIKCLLVSKKERHV